MATPVDSVLNQNTVNDVHLTEILSVASVLNQNTVNDVHLTEILSVASVLNQNTVSDISVRLFLEPDTLVNQSTVTPVFRALPGLSVRSVDSIQNASIVSEIAAGEGIILSSVLNTNIVPSVSVPGIEVINTESIPQANKFGSIIFKVQAPEFIPVAPTNPIDRPITNLIEPSERVIDGQIGERASILKDLSISFKAHPLTGEPVRVLNYNSINQAFRNILLTDKTERPMTNLRFGANIKAQLFEVMSPTLERDIKETIQREILNYEPRVLIKKVNVDSKTVPYGVTVRIEYKIRTFEQTTEFELFIERV